MDLSDDINPAKDDLRTPLHVAAEKGHMKICELIISKIDDKHPKDGNDEMPLHLAADNGHFKICKMFMRMLEDKNPKGYYGFTVLRQYCHPFSDVSGNTYLLFVKGNIG